MEPGGLGATVDAELNGGAPGERRMDAAAWWESARFMPDKKTFRPTPSEQPQYPNRRRFLRLLFKVSMGAALVLALLWFLADRYGQHLRALFAVSGSPLGGDMNATLEEYRALDQQKRPPRSLDNFGSVQKL